MIFIKDIKLGLIPYGPSNGMKSLAVFLDEKDGEYEDYKNDEDIQKMNLTTEEEVVELMKDIRNVGVRLFTIGQYLQPTHKHIPVIEYVTPEQFAKYREIGMSLGFDNVESGPLVRSSYMAEKTFIESKIKK